MKKVLLAILVLVVLGVGYLYLNPVGARPDGTFDAAVSTPAYTSEHPVVLFDEGHNNPHRIDDRYAPFAKLLRNDGYELRAHRGAFTRESLQDANVLVIVNASGGTNPQLFGFNLPALRKGERDAPAFTAEEIQVIAEWVQGGGSLWLVADHYPFGSAAASLASAFGVTMHGGYVEVADQFPNQGDPSTLEFVRSTATLLVHPITEGRSLAERLIRVVTFTGQSLDGPDSASAFMRLPLKAKEFVPPPPNFQETQAGDAQGLAMDFGGGRVVVLGEAAALTAQVDGTQRFGMNVAPENKQFVLNVMHWLTRLL